MEENLHRLWEYINEESVPPHTNTFMAQKRRLCTRKLIAKSKNMTIIKAAERNHLYLWVTITRNGEKKECKMKPAELKKSIKRHETFYGCTQVSNSYNDYEQTIRFTKGIEFHIILY